MAKRKTKLDAEITRLFYKHASGVQINILDLGKIHVAGREAAASGTSVEDAVVAAIARFRVN